MASEKVNLTVFAHRCGFSIQSAQRYVAGTRMPRRDEMVRIYVVTGGDVTPNDFYDLPCLQQAAA